MYLFFTLYAEGISTTVAYLFSNMWCLKTSTESISAEKYSLKVYCNVVFYFCKECVELSGRNVSGELYFLTTKVFLNVYHAKE